MLLFSAAVSFSFASKAQHAAPASASSKGEIPGGQEDIRAMRTREFLGLGRKPDAKAAGDGAKLFGPTCGFCHGADARGGVGPDLLRSAVVLDDDQGELVSPVIHNGRPANGMPAFPTFTDEQNRDIAEFLHLQVELAANRGTYKVLNIVTGDSRAGAIYFNGEGKCNMCHAVTGDMAHIGSKFEPADLQQTFLYPAARESSPPGRQAAPNVTVTLLNGKKMTGRLQHLDDFGVSFFDGGDNVHSVALEPDIKVEVEDKLVVHRQMLDRYTDTQMHDLTAYLVTLK